MRWDDDGDDPGRLTGRSESPRWVCLECTVRGRGYRTHGEHWRATVHQIVWGSDPRASTTAPSGRHAAEMEQCAAPEKRECEPHEEETRR